MAKVRTPGEPTKMEGGIKVKLEESPCAMDKRRHSFAAGFGIADQPTYTIKQSYI